MDSHCFSPEAVTRFWSYVLKQSGDDACWLWQASCTSAGYGQFVDKQKHFLAHRIAWQLTHGPVPVGEDYHGTCVLHRCDNPRCVRPDHLFLGSNLDNIRDMYAKNRQPKGEEMWLLSPRGEHVGSSKLNNSEVRAIRALNREYGGSGWGRGYSGGLTRKQLASVYNVGQATISNVILRKRWRFV